MFWFCLIGLYLLGVPVTLFLMATVGLADEDDISNSELSDIVLFTLFWPIVVVFFLSCLGLVFGEKLNAKLKGKRE